MKYSTTGLTGFILLNSLLSFCQSNTVSSGGESNGTGGTASYSVGQIEYQQFTGSGGSVNLGVQQPYLIEETNVLNELGEMINVIIGPNPITDQLSIRSESEYVFQLNISDLNGKIILKEQLFKKETLISMSQWASGVYYLQINVDQKLVKQIKLIKH